MPEALFLFVQLEYPWLLGLPDGRYLLRSDPDADPERVVVLGTLAAARAVAPSRRSALAGRLGSGRSLAETSPEAASVSTARVTIVDPVPLSAERQAQAWIDSIDPEEEAQAAVDVLNRVLHFQRVTSADPHVHEVSASHAPEQHQHRHADEWLIGLLAGEDVAACPDLLHLGGTFRFVIHRRPQNSWRAPRATTSDVVLPRICAAKGLL